MEQNRNYKLTNDVYISFVIPAYNASRYITKAVETISNVRQNYEIIIIDDGSSDDTYNVCLELQNKYRKIAIYKQSNKGVSAARNLGIEMSKGKWIFFCDADDWVDAENLSLILDKIDYTDRNVVFFAKYSVLPKPKGIQRRHIPDNIYDTPEAFLNSEYYQKSSWNYLFPTSLIKNNNILFPSNIVNTEDQNFNIKCIACCNRVISFDIPVYYYNFLNTDSASHTNKSFKWKIGPLESAIDLINFCKRENIKMNIISSQIRQLVEYYYLYNIYGTYTKNEIRNVRGLLNEISAHCNTIRKSPKYFLIDRFHRMGLFFLKIYNKTIIR